MSKLGHVLRFVFYGLVAVSMAAQAYGAWNLDVWQDEIDRMSTVYSLGWGALVSLMIALFGFPPALRD